MSTRRAQRTVIDVIVRGNWFPSSTKQLLAVLVSLLCAGGVPFLTRAKCMLVTLVYNEFVGDAFVVANGVPLVYNEFVGDAFVVANGVPFMLRG